MVHSIVALVLAAMISISPMLPDKAKSQQEWKSIGKCRITTYCHVCNDGHGYESTSGKRLKYGYAACRWLPNGTIISVEGEIFEIADTCGTGAIDLFVDTDGEECKCNVNEYRRVSIKAKRRTNERKNNDSQIARRKMDHRTGKSRRVLRNNNIQRRKNHLQRKSRTCRAV